MTASRVFDSSRRCFSPLFSEDETPQVDQGIQTSGVFRIRRLKELLNQFIDLAAKPVQALSNRQLDDMRLRLNGAFERLLKYQKTFSNLSTQTNSNQQLVQVIEACLGDLELKLKSIALSDGSSESELQSVRDFIGQLTENSLYLDIEELMPKILVYLRNTKASQGLSNLRNVMQRNRLLVVKKAWNELNSFKTNKDRSKKLLKQLVVRHDSRQQYGNLTRTFQSWKDQLRQQSTHNTVIMLQQYAEFFKETITSHNITKISNFFDGCKEFLTSSLAIPLAQIDLIFINNHKEALTFIEQKDEDTDDRERMIDIESQASLLKQFIKKAYIKKAVFIQNSTEKQQFNQSIDAPYIARQSTYLKGANSLDQMTIGLFKKRSDNDKKLKFIVRLTLRNDHDSALSKDETQAIIIDKLQKVESLIIQSFKVFRKLHYQFKNLNHKLESMVNSSSLIDKATVSQLQYLQTKSLELSYVVSVSDCFKLINIVVRELYNYDKVSVLQYSQGAILRMNISSQVHPDSEDVVTLVEEGITGSVKLVRDLVQTNITNMTNISVIDNHKESSNKEQLESHVRQECSEGADRCELSGRSLNDTVVISLDLKNSHSLIDVSTVYQLTTDPGTQSNITPQIQYFLRLEKKLQRAKDQECFMIKNESFVVLKSFIQLMLISINKMKIIQSQREAQAQKLFETLQSKAQMQETNADQEISKVSIENDCLKRLIQLQKMVDEFLDDLKSQNEAKCNSETGLLYFEDFHLKLLSFLHVLIPNCKRLQLFLSKDPAGNVFYTYINQPNQIYQEVITPQIYVQSNDDSIDSSIHMTCQFGGPTPKTSHFKRQSLSNNNREDKSRNTFVQAASEDNIHNSNEMRVSHRQFYTNYQLAAIPSQMDDISSISPHNNERNCDQIFVQNIDKTSEGTSNYTVDPVGMQEQRNMQLNGENQRSSFDPLTKQTSGFNFQTSSQSLQRQQNRPLSNQRSLNNQKKSILKRDLSAKTELNQNLSAQLNPQRQQYNQQTISDLSSHRTRTQQRQEPFIIQQQQNPASAAVTERVITSFDEMIIFHSHLNEESEMLVNIQSQDPQRVKKIEFRVAQQKSIIKQSLQQMQGSIEGLIKRNVKNDKAYNEAIDNQIYSYQPKDGKKKERYLENAIYMPMVNSRSQVTGLIQIGNSDKQLLFTESDLDIVRLVAFKVANFISEARDQYHKRAQFKKQMEVSLLHSSLEAQSIAKVLTLANQLFQQDHSHPLLAVGYFIKKTEKYLRQAFNCQYSQMLIIDHNKHGIYSFDVQDKQSRLLRRGEAYADYSITNAMIKGNFHDPIVWPGPNEQQSHIFIGDDNQNTTSFDQCGQVESHMNFYTQFINFFIDCPLSYLTNEIPATYLAMTIRDQQDPTRVLGIIQLMTRTNNIRFTDQDIAHLGLLSNHLSQVFTYISSEGLLSQLSEEQSSKLQTFYKLMNRKYRQQMKYFFRELLQYQYGKVNLLKNKIMRKYMDKHMKVDQKLINKIEKLAEIRDKCSLNRKQEVLNTLKQKVKYLNQQRQVNAMKCLQVVNKYNKILGIRVKDTVFRFWDRLRREGVSLTHQSPTHMTSIDEPTDELLSPSFNGGQRSIMIHDQSLSSISNLNNNSSILEESSITSVLYSRAKAIYKVRRLFNQHRLKKLFDMWIIKVFHMNHHNFLFNLEGLRLVKIHAIMSKWVRRLNEQVFQAFYMNSISKFNQQKCLQKVASKRGFRDMSFGLKQWQNYTEKSIKNEMRQDKSFISQLADQCRDTNILQTMMSGLNQIFAQFNFQSVDDVLESNALKLFFINLADLLTEQLPKKHTAQQIVITFELPESYSQDNQSHYCMFVCPDSNDRLKFNLSVVDRSKQSKQEGFVNEIMQLPSIDFEDVNVVNGQEVKQPFITVFEGESDSIFNQLSHAQSPISYSKLDQINDQNQLFQHLLPSLKVRQAVDHSGALLIPMINNSNGSHIFGSLEIYTSKLSREVVFSQEEQNRFKQQAQVLQIGLESLSQRLSMIHQVSHSLNSERSLLQMGGQYQSGLKQMPISAMILQMTRRIQKLMQADHTLIVFVPHEQLGEKGFFYNFETNQLFQIDISQTIFQDMLESGNLSSVTFPVSQNQSSSRKKLHWNRDSPALEESGDTFESVTGEMFGALKYMTIQLNEGLTIFVEIGWAKMFCTQKQDETNMVKNVIHNDISRIAQQLKIFTRVIGRKMNQILGQIWLRGIFNRWKEVSYIPTLYYSRKAEVTPVHIQHSRKQSTDKRHRNSNDYSPSFQQPYIQNGKQKNQRAKSGNIISRTATQQTRQMDVKSQKRSISQGYESNEKSNISSRSRTASQMSNNVFGHSLTKFNNEDQILSELEVEKAAKRKLVSAALFMIAVQNRQTSKLQLRSALSEWKSFLNKSQIAESAFNKLLELNHKHSKARFQTATNILTRIARKNLGKVLFKILRNVDPAHNKLLSSGMLYGNNTQDAVIKIGQVRHQRIFSDPTSFNSQNQGRISRYMQEIYSPKSPNDGFAGSNEFEEEMLDSKRNILTQNRAHENNQHRGFKDSNVKNTIKVVEDEVQSEFSLGTGNGTKGVNRHVRGDSGYKGCENLSQKKSARQEQQRQELFKLMPVSYQETNTYQNMFKRF